MTERNDERQDEQYDEQLQQTASEFRSGDAGDLGNDLRLSEEQELIKQQSEGEFPVPRGEGLEGDLEDVPPLGEERAATDVPGDELHNTDEADASDDPYNLGGQDT
ncbi:hypothetical protein D477_021423 [Arthrobacter crystallopoietes BAB-32]|uniref:Uncharacterized protein n=1 Tax=Arthrobacter crystallopoietes BAB-32 TaxID=1246476 RepID=N1V1R9_9MICC|nr:hypothetical protein [Arthrobacter crystallopoietes]EMY32193.1 hypothetical protein D477_021423 [Arthrobacter crystallopoietes BAB-32]